MPRISIGGHFGSHPIKGSKWARNENINNFAEKVAGVRYVCVEGIDHEIRRLLENKRRKKMIDFFYYVRSIIYKRSLCECAAIGIIPASFKGGKRIS